MGASPADLIDPFLLQLLACNADDGTACNMAGIPELRSALAAAWAAFDAGLSVPNAQEAFFECFRTICVGHKDMPLAPERPSAPPLSTLLHDPLDVPSISTVVTTPTLLRIISEADRQRFERLGIRFNASGVAAADASKGLAQDRMLSRFEALPSTERRFRFSEDETHGRPFVWFTATDDAQLARREAMRAGRSPADRIRDLLGLVHHGPNLWFSDVPNHLFILHLPSAVAERAGYLRPTVVEALDNRRFVVRFEESDMRSASDWGSTIDLQLFAEGGKRPPVGGRERVLLRLQKEVFEPFESVTFDYLGRVTTARGNEVGLDDDGSFLNLIRRSRDAAKLAEDICA